MYDNVETWLQEIGSKTGHMQTKGWQWPQWPWTRTSSFCAHTWGLDAGFILQTMNHSIFSAGGGREDLKDKTTSPPIGQESWKEHPKEDANAVHALTQVNQQLKRWQ